MREAHLRLLADPKFAAKHRERIQKMHADPEFAAKLAERARERMRELHADPEFAAKNAERMRKLHADPEFAARRDERIRRLHADPEFAAANSERAREHIRKLNARTCAVCGKHWSSCNPLVEDSYDPGIYYCADLDACDRRFTGETE